MFGLIKPFHMFFRRRLPQDALGACLNVEKYAEAQLHELSEAERTHALAFILSVWARDNRVSGASKLSIFFFRRILEAGERSAKLLSPFARQRADAVLEELRDKGLI
jgi:hypothetical protein